jgi:hypothetical protein
LHFDWAIAASAKNEACDRRSRADASDREVSQQVRVGLYLSGDEAIHRDERFGPRILYLLQFIEFLPVGICIADPVKI